VKSGVYVSPLPANIQELKTRMTKAIQTVTPDMLQNMWNEFDYCVDIIWDSEGGHLKTCNFNVLETNFIICSKNWL